MKTANSKVFMKTYCGGTASLGSDPAGLDFAFTTSDQPACFSPYAQFSNACKIISFQLQAFITVFGVHEWFRFLGSILTPH